MGLLVSTEIRSPPPPDQGIRRQGRRDTAREVKNAQRQLTESVSSALCLYAPGRVVVDVGRALTAHVTGPHRCGSPWACMVCAPVIRQRRALEVNTGLAGHLESGGGGVFLTATCQHALADALEPRLAAMASLLGQVLKGSAWNRYRERLGIIGSIRAIEVPWSDRAGWHPHNHFVLLTDEAVPLDEWRAFHRWLFDRCASLFERSGFGWLHPVHGLDLQPLTLSSIGTYLSKLDNGWTVGHELTRSDRKSSTPFVLLRELVVTGETKWADLWCEYERATFGKRSLRWSAGLRARLLGDETETSDVDLARSEGLDLALLRAVVESSEWNRFVSAGRDGQLCSQIEGMAAVLIMWSDLLGHDLMPLDVPSEVTQ